jgi:hypothetical protein
MEHSLFGAWAETAERFADVFDGSDSRAVEASAQQMAREAGGTLWVCRVFRDVHVPVDTYTKFIDPRDERNLEIEDIELDVPDFLHDHPQWLVLGFALPKGMPIGHPEFGWTAERYSESVYAPSPLTAEDAARSRLEDKGADFLVCSVLPDSPVAADTYAKFADSNR